jgi:hypothetical protein
MAWMYMKTAGICCCHAISETSSDWNISRDTQGEVLGKIVEKCLQREIITNNKVGQEELDCKQK